jgi:diaminopimelate epimerase
MRIFNADGSEGEMCGNGIRCVGKFVYEKGLTQKVTLTVETLGGIKTLWLHTEGDQVSAVTVDTGIPTMGEGRTLRILGGDYLIRPVSMGNPHAVTFLTEIDDLELTALGPCFEHHPSFPYRTNTEFVEVLDRTDLKMRVWERGSGETLACGTGACAALAAAVTEGRTERNAFVRLPGGEISLRWDENDGHIYMTGPAVTVYEGEWPDTKNKGDLP